MGKMLATTYIYCKNEMELVTNDLVEFLAQCSSSGRLKNDGSYKELSGGKRGGKLISVGNLIATYLYSV